MSRFAFLLLLLTHLAVAVPPVDAMVVGASDPPEFGGFVRNAVNGQPVTGAIVSAGARIATTGVDGEFRLPVSMAGRYVVRVESATYHTAEELAAVDEGRVDLNFALAPRWPEGRVFGIVRDSALGRPIAQAAVFLDGTGYRTDTKGRFLFDRIDAGDRLLSVTAPGYKSASKRIRVDAQEEQVNVVLTPDSTIVQVEGIALDRSSGEPLPRTMIAVGDDRTVTDEEGCFALPERAPGEARLVIARDGYCRQDVSIDIKPGRTHLTIRLDRIDAAEILHLMRRAKPLPPPTPIAPSAAASAPPVPSPTPSHPDERIVAADVTRWESAASGTICARGMTLDITHDSDLGSTTALRRSVGLRVTESDRIAIDHARFARHGTLRTATTFDGLDYAPGAKLETRTELRHTGLSRRLSHSADRSLWFDYGMFSARTKLRMTQFAAGPECTFSTELRTGEFETSLEIPYFGFTGRARMSGNVIAEASAKGSSWSPDGGTARLTDATLAFLIGGDYFETPEKLEWYGSLGYRIFLLYGSKGGETIDLKYSGPMFGFKGSL